MQDKSMQDIVFIVLPVFLVVFLGKGLQLTRLIDPPFIKTANRLIFNVCLPALLFHKIANADVHHILNIPLLLIMTATVLLVFFISFIVTRTALIPDRARGSFMTNNFRGNFAYMGLPVSYYAFGDPGLLYASVFMAFLVPLVNLLSVVSLGMFAGRSSVSVFIKNSLFNPLAIGCFLGLAASYADMVLPEFVSRTLVIVSGVTLPLALFCIGASLTLHQLKGNILIIFLSSGFKLLIMPALVLLLLLLFDQPIDTMAKVLVVMAASPSATVNYILAATMGGDVDSTSGTIVITTLLSIFTYVFWLSRLGL